MEALAEGQPENIMPLIHLSMAGSKTQTLQKFFKYSKTDTNFRIKIDPVLFLTS